MSSFLLVLFVSFFSFSVISVPDLDKQEPPLPSAKTGISLPAPDFLIWQPSRLLHWNDFRGEPEATDKIHGAVTYAGLDVELEDERPMRFSVVAVFDRQRSWVQPERKDDLLLAHEQLHFDIAAVYALKLEKKLNSLANKWDRKGIKSVIADYQQAQLKAQEQYDEESLHGIRQEQQQAWRKLVDRELRHPSANLQISKADWTNRN
ncbi:DUF922 domain-containing protein [Nafulsella turpanensis]|uniref:DUF922 domain-containing protein n=1 Tax=Nafulsella turpanensis TaxID=1265690 RepID=UPI000346A303|nr:DUF922 domain-containing protein [Nafulsella turpanensis]